MESKTFKKWLSDMKENRIKYLDNLKEFNLIWKQEYRKAMQANISKEITIDDYNAVKGYYKHTLNAIVMNINDKEYLLYNGSGAKAKYFIDCGLGEVSQQDIQLIQYYTREDMIKHVEKDIEHHKKLVLTKVEKICGKDIASVNDDGNELYITGSNNHTAHLWAIYAGGYNIQCLHIRILVKEIKH